MSAFSSVDHAPEPRRLIEFLEDSAVGLAAMKHYLAAAQAIRNPTAPILDLGCGAGHDLVLLDALGVGGVGVDPSSVMVDAARDRTPAPLVRADGIELPFADGAFAGCWIERVLMHVADPAAVVAEVVRCVQPGGLLTIFEPDWSSLTVCGDRVPVEWLTIARHPSVGASAGTLATDAGCSLLDRVEERSWWTHEAFQRITNLRPALDRAVHSGRADRREVESWLAAVQRRVDDGSFSAEMTKVAWVARTPARGLGAVVGVSPGVLRRAPR